MAARTELRLLDIPVTIDPAFFIFAVLLGLGGGRDAAALLGWVAVVLVSVLGHELGHALAFRRFGQSSRIHLHAMGGLTAPTGPAPLSPRQDILVGLAGPVPGIVLGGLLLAVIDRSSPVSLLDRIVLDLALVNVGWGVFNLMPILPFDGGQVLAGVFASRGRGWAWAVVVSVVVGVGLAVAGFVTGQTWLGAVFALLAAFNAAALVKRRRMRAVARSDPLAEGYEALERGATLAAANRAREALPVAATPKDRDGAVNLLMWTHLLAGDPERAAAAVVHDPPLDPLSPLLDPRVVRAAGGADAAGMLLRQAFEALPCDATGTQLARGLVELGRLDEAVALVDDGRAPLLDAGSAAVVGAALFRSGRYADAARLGEASFARGVDKAMAYNVACAWLREGKADEALAWLNRAVDAGYRNVAELDGDPNLSDLRGTPGFTMLRSRLAQGDA